VQLVTTAINCNGGKATVTSLYRQELLHTVIHFNSTTNTTGEFLNVSAGTGLSIVLLMRKVWTSSTGTVVNPA
jgi:hypothetical protein